MTVGCVHVSDLETSYGSIFFDVKSALLKGGESTKGATPKTSFSNGDTFFVYGSKTISNVKEAVFTGDQVQYNNLAWTYSPIRSWDSRASRYDFLCISGPGTNTGITCNPTTNPIRASLIYDPTVSQYDLMAACASRVGNSNISPVALNFSHLLSAVSVSIHNDSPLQEITVNSYGFKNICTQKTVTVDQYDNVASVNWASPGYNRNIVLGSPNANTDIAPGEYYPTTPIVDLMIPQELDLVAVYRPTFVLDYQYTEDGASEPTHIVTNILLEEIEILGSTDYITEWTQGTHYHYDIHIRIGGGIRITVRATDWEIIYAETPGLTI